MSRRNRKRRAKKNHKQNVYDRQKGSNNEEQSSDNNLQSSELEQEIIELDEEIVVQQSYHEEIENFYEPISVESHNDDLPLEEIINPPLEEGPMSKSKKKRKRRGRRRKKQNTENLESENEQPAKTQPVKKSRKVKFVPFVMDPPKPAAAKNNQIVESAPIRLKRNPNATDRRNNYFSFVELRKSMSISNQEYYLNNTRYQCRFCKNNPRFAKYSRTHEMLCWDGYVQCWFLRRVVCPICKATGDLAHTRKYCPQNQQRRPQK